MQANWRPVQTIVLLIWSFATAGLAGQDLESKQSQATSIKVRTNFVQVAVLVQRSGKHVPSLTKRNFVVQQDGKNQPIATFEEVHAAAAVPGVGPGQEFTNTGDAATNPRQITIIAIDTVNTSAIDQAYFKEEFLKFLGEADEGLFGLVELTRSGVRILHDYTTDPKALLSAVQKSGPVQSTKNNDKSPLIKEEADEAYQRLELEPSAETQRRFDNAALVQEAEDRMVQFQDRAARFDTLASLQQLAQALKGLPGRKTLLWVGSGFELLGGLSRVKGITNLSSVPAKFGDEALDQYAYTCKQLSDANVAVYPIDTRRTVNTAYEVMNPSQKYTPLVSQRELARQVDRETLDSFQEIAAETGGKPCIFRTDLHECMREAVKENAAYYLLGFYVDKARSAPGWHRIKVTFDEKATLRYRSGFLIAPNASEAFRNMDLHLALNSPFNYTALPFRGRFSGFEENGARKNANFELNIPPSSVTIEEDSGKVNFDVWAVVRAVGGAEVARLGQRIDRKLTPRDIAAIKADGVYYKNKIALAAGQYGVWLVVRDNLTGRTGSVVVPLRVP
jgi:VWFA-related protein